MLRRVALLRTGVSEERIAFIITTEIISKLGKTLAIPSFFRSAIQLLVTADVPSSLIFPP
jgi:hypothetical protein